MSILNCFLSDKRVSMDVCQFSYNWTGSLMDIFFVFDNNGLFY